MRKLEEDRWHRNRRGDNRRELKDIADKVLVDLELESLTLFKLLKAFQNVVARIEDKKAQAVHKVYRYNYSVQGQQVFILSKVRWGERTSFKAVFGACQDRMHAIITFLAMLELLNMGKLQCTQGIGNNNFWLEVPDPNASAEEEK